MYAIHLTRLATAIATTKYSVEAVEATARKELDELDCDDPTQIFFHCFRMPTVQEYEFICKPDHQGGIAVDTVTYEKLDEPVVSGPFKGRRLQMPRSDSEEQ